MRSCKHVPHTSIYSLELTILINVAAENTTPMGMDNRI